MTFGAQLRRLLLHEDDGVVESTLRRWFRPQPRFSAPGWTMGCAVLGAVACGPAAAGDGDGSSEGSSTTAAGTTADPAEGSTAAIGTTTEIADATGSDGGSSGVADETTTGSEPACALGAPFPEPVSDHVLEHGGLERSFEVHVPPGYDHRTPTPLVLAFHGYTNSPQQQEEWSGLSLAAAEAGYVLVYPRGTGILPGWNAGDCCLGAGSMVDDVGFTAAMIDQLQTELCIDPRRIYATGFSNGGFLSHRLACELSDRIAAIASVAGVMGIDTCMPGRPMPVLHMHGTADPVVPYQGSAILGFESVAETIADWQARDACEGDPVVSYQQDEVTCERFEACADGVEVELCTIEGGGHTWPGGADIFGAGPTTDSLSANDRLWEFFVAHPLP